MQTATPIVTYSIPQAMEILKLSRQSVYDEINASRLRTYRVGRRRFVSADALQDWIKEREADNAPVAA